MAKADALMKGAVETTPPKLNPVIESPADKKKRLDSKRVMVMRERELIKTKLVEVDKQRKQLQDDHNKIRSRLGRLLLRRALRHRRSPSLLRQ